MSPKNVVLHISNLADGISDKDDLHSYMIAIVNTCLTTFDSKTVLDTAVKALPRSYSGTYKQQLLIELAND